MRNKNILISGAGIAGTTLAYWLRRHGFTPTVVERAPAIREGGYKIDIRGAALKVVERMGVLDEIRRLRTDVRGGSIVTATGRAVASMDGDTFGGREGEDAEILRGDLQRVLHDLTRDEVEYLLDDSIAALTEVGDEVKVTFDSGRTRVFDLVVGADGLHSATRALAFGPEARFVRDLGYYVSIFSVPNHLDLDRWELTYVSPRRTSLTYSTAGATGAKAMFLFASEPLEYDHRDRDRQQRILADAYAGEGWEVPRLIGGMNDAPDFYFDSLSQVHMDRWSKGRTALVGDAAYCASPASGQGTSLALVGAYVLAGELAAAGGDHRAGFDGYERALRHFAEQNQNLGPANVKRMVMRSKSQVWFSLKMLALMNRMPGKDRMMAKIVEPIHRAATAIALSDY
ncbi:FAD-dependent monooxygenase [Streptosporangium roseum]|uniref:Oxidoreductase n=1 Tax=Streptosporangium roseum (strain ATCC 12428 / DSM 43021 / JCM 3005 / KCTC 9067 / NCIMB 10171 / NRRL 2505 / NI 9100) TaxID=479432 RepID=D2BFK9_STRRD|nr:FAD-dependent monooxygenase [Streptosporangium roseum]ACZ90170.1 putative oxidoreductase [Streptosporangium roseum DSM 43021]